MSSRTGYEYPECYQLTRPTPNRLEWWMACAAAAAAAIAWGFWYHAGLVLSHYDAKAHLVVARRVFDNLTPGWQQIGAVWLPLPHLINLFPTQIDFFYRTGIFASAVSIACFSLTAWAAARLIRNLTGSVAGMVTATLLLVLNPNLLYLYATPMTEPLLIAVTFVLVLWLQEWLAGDANAPLPRKLQVLLFAAAWTRYEAWLVLAAAIGARGGRQVEAGRSGGPRAVRGGAPGGVAGGCGPAVPAEQPRHRRRVVRLERLLRARLDVPEGSSQNRCWRSGGVRTR